MSAFKVLGEKYIQIFKGGMKKLVNTALDVLLEWYCTNCTAGQLLADLFLNRHVLLLSPVNAA